MEIQYIHDNVSSDFSKVREKIVAERPVKNVDEFLNQYDPKKHPVLDKTKRIDKIVTVTNAHGTTTKKVDATRVTAPFQKLIVRRSVGFLLGNDVELSTKPTTEEEKKILKLVKHVWDSNKLYYDNKRIMEILLTETRVAELWYPEPAKPDAWKGTANEGKPVWFRMKILAKSKGDEIYPVFNNNGDLISISREFATKDDEGRTINRFEIYTDTKTYFGYQGDAGWVLDKDEVNEIGKILMVYYEIPVPDFYDVNEAIEEYELSNSDHGDTNKYNGSPILKAKGKINGFSDKGEQGKVVQMEGDADLSYVTWDHSIESVVAYKKELRSIIFDTSDTPDFSFEQMKSIGADSSLAMRLLFIGAHMKASFYETVIGEGFQRRLNLLVAMVTSFNSSLKKAATISIRPKFEPYLPKNDEGKVDTLNAAKQAGTLSQKTAVYLNPLVSDPDIEYAQLQKEGANQIMNEEI